MYEELYDPIPDTGRFLERIGLAGYKTETTLECLDTLIKAYVSHIPFENLTVAYFHQVPGLGINDLYNKIILHKRGGYCHEMNGLFLAFLQTLGFEAYSVSVFVREDLDYLNDLGHRSNICVIDGRKYFVEAGYGGSAPVCAVPLDGQARGGYFIRLSENEYHVYKITGTSCDGKDPSYKETLMFRDFKAYPVEFILPNKGIALDPENRFRKNIIVNFCNEAGEVFQIDNDMFTAKTAGGRISRKIENDAELRQVLLEYFNIDISDF